MLRVIIALFYFFIWTATVHVNATVSPLEVNTLSSKPAPVAGKLLHVNDKACPNSTFRSIEQCQNLQLVTEAVPNFGFLSARKWFLFSLENSATEARQVYIEIDYPLLDNIEFYALNKKKQIISHIITGDRLPFSSRPLAYPSFVFPLTIAAEEQVDIRFRIGTGSAMQVPIQIWEPQAFVAQKSQKLLLIGLFVGAMFIMALYNFLLFYSTADKGYLFFALTLLFYGLMQCNLSGLSYAYLWPDAVTWNDKSTYVLGCLALIHLSLFARIFLRLRQTKAVTGLLLQGAAGLMCMSLILVPIVEYRYLAVLLGTLALVLPLLTYVKGIRMWLGGHALAGYFVVAMTCFVFTLGLYVLSNFGLLPRLWFTEYSFHLSAAALVSLLSMTLAERVSRDKLAKEMAQASASDSRRKFEDIYHNSSEGMFRLSPKGAFISANTAFLNMLKSDSLAELQSSYGGLHKLLADAEDILAVLQRQGHVRRDVVFANWRDEQIWAKLNLRFTKDALEGDTIIEGTMINISDRKRIEEKLLLVANVDQLTGLDNRHAFQVTLQEMIDDAGANDSQHALIYVDLDRFKLVNDTCGHHAGDELLKQLASVLRQTLGSTIKIARTGGDEFAVVLQDVTREGAERTAETLQHALSHFRFVWQEKQFEVGASIGIVPINQYSDSVVNLMTQADSACLMAKETGRNRVVFHDEDVKDIQSKVHAKSMLALIHDAIESNHFVLYRQKIQALGEVQVNAYEILLRMQIDDQLVSPDVFVPAAERYNVIPGIDKWAVSTFIDLLSRDSRLLSDLDMATINLSGQTLSNPDFLPYLLELLQAFPQVSRKLCFEITESAALANLAQSTELMQQLKETGVRFAVDDFGSGYASYNYLTKLPIDFVKIDGSFCIDLANDPVNQMVIRSITEIAHTIGIRVIAEFVEDKQTLTLLEEIGVDFVQGYYIEKPCALDVLQYEQNAAEGSDTLTLKPVFFT